MTGGEFLERFKVLTHGAPLHEILMSSPENFASAVAEQNLILFL